MNKTVVLQEELVDRIYRLLNDKGINIYKKDVREVFKGAFEEIRAVLNEGGKVRINDFAIIYIYTAKPSKVMHPVTGEIIPRNVKSKKIKFTPIGDFKEELKINKE